MKTIAVLGAVAALAAASCSRQPTASGAGLHNALDLAADGVTVSGFVRDAAGAPVRGALIIVADGPRSVARFSGATGVYRIPGVPRKAVQITVSGWGYDAQIRQLKPDKDIAADFQLTPLLDAQTLTSAEILTVIPANKETQWLQVRCINCHGFTQLGHLRGATHDQWLSVFKIMQLNYGREELMPADWPYAAQLTTKYFGPDAGQPTAQTVRRVPVSDAALKATFYMIDLPATGRVLPHSITADNKGGAWVAEYGKYGNSIVRWDLASGALEPIAMKMPDAGAHTPTIDHKGRIWTALITAKQLTVIDPLTRTIEYMPLESYPHTLSTDADGFIWGSGQKIFRVDPETRAITYWTPASAPRASDSWSALGRTPGAKADARYHIGTSPLDPYHAVRDSKGMVWFTSYSTGLLTRLDPATGKQDIIRIPGVSSSRGIDIDANDVVWFSSWAGHALVKYDPATGKSEQFRFPTEFAAPYSIRADKMRGYIWVADFTGNHITRFDPRSGAFVEYPLPHNESYPRFISLDSQGRVWFAEWWNSRLGVLDPGY